MPTLIVFTDPSRVGTCDVPPFVTGDATNAWTIKTHNGTAYYAAAGVTMKIGNINGLTAAVGTAFKWTDRAGNTGTYDIGLASNIPSLTLASSTGTAPSLVGSNGVYLIRGQPIGGGSSIKRFELTSPGLSAAAIASCTVTVAGGGGTGGAATASVDPGQRSISGLGLSAAGSGYITPPSVVFNSPTQPGPGPTYTTWSTLPQGYAVLNDQLYETPFKSNDASQAVMGSVEMSPFSDGKRDASGRVQYDHSFVVVKPRDVATASLSASGNDWVGTMDPINNWVTALLGLRRSVALDLQIFGDGRMLYEGTLVILNKIG